MSSNPQLPPEVAYLWQQMKTGKAFLLLGAGASRNSRNSAALEIRSGLALAEELARQAGLPYSEEELPDVVQAAVGLRLSEKQWHDLLRREYVGCRAGEDLKSLFRYSWARAYTLNVDDSVERIGKLPSGQHLIPYNARVDRVATKDERNPSDLHLVHLNGDANKPEHGLVFSRDEYAKALTQNELWYAELATDYYRYTPVIIGSRLREPILEVELERIKQRDGKSGAAFLVVPDQLTEIQKSVFASKNIIYLPLTLQNFVEAARRELGDSLSVANIATDANEQLSASMLAALTPADVSAAMAVYPITVAAQQSALRVPSAQLNRMARDFLLGAPASWPLVLSGVPVELQDGKGLLSAMQKEVANGRKMIVVIGAAGCGKSTLVKQALLQLLRQDKGVFLYDLRGDAHSYNRVFSILRRLHPGQRVYVHLDNLFMYGDKLSADLEALRDNDIVLVTSARSGEWRERFQRHFGGMAATFELKRFQEDDYGPLTERLLRYVPSPTFAKATPQQRQERFAKSRRQLLIALREITESRRFDEVIDDEYTKLPDDATRFAFRIAGVATLARVGLGTAVAFEIYRSRRFGRSFESALSALEGIVVTNSQGRLQVRHELYAEHVFRHHDTVDDYLVAVEAILSVLARYQVPLITSLSRLDAQLFKYLLNHRTLFRRSRTVGIPGAGLALYEKFEKAFEQDGHFWLQYGLYARGLGKTQMALDLLDKSIQAYPENPQAIHARADLKLRLASDPDVSDARANSMIEEAVADLLSLDARDNSRTDLYPLVTLADRHVFALMKRHQSSKAKECARRYFAQVQERERHVNAPILSRLKANLLKYVTTGVWVATEYNTFDDGG